jgi:hypothetical protein
MDGGCRQSGLIGGARIALRRCGPWNRAGAREASACPHGGPRVVYRPRGDSFTVGGYSSAPRTAFSVRVAVATMPGFVSL